RTLWRMLFAHLFEPPLQLVADRRALLAAQLKVLRRSDEAGFERKRFDAIQVADELERALRLGCGRDRLEEIATDVRVTADASPAVDRDDRVVAGVPIDDERARGATQHRLRRLTAARRREGVRDDWLG